MLAETLKGLTQRAYLPISFKKWWLQFGQGFGFRVKLWLNEIQTAARYSDCFWTLASLWAKVLLCRKKCWFDWFIFINSNNLQWDYCKIDLYTFTIYYQNTAVYTKLPHCKTIDFQGPVCIMSEGYGCLAINLLHGGFKLATKSPLLAL